MKRTLSPLIAHYTPGLTEAGCDEAGRGCLAGPVVAAAVILPRGFRNNMLTDSKQLSAKKRDQLRLIIEKEALDWSVAFVDAAEIDELNILYASILAMHHAVDGLRNPPQLLLIDGNRFKAYGDIPHVCIIKGDSKILSIAAASVLAKTHRDEYMVKIHEMYPEYFWRRNKGYPSAEHRKAIAAGGISPYHRKTFRLTGQLKLDI